MSKIGRNAPCPCGSGKKYKKCCLRTDQGRESDARRRAEGVELALDWLLQHHRESGLAQLRAHYFEPWDVDLLDDEEAVPRDALDLMWSNALEWLIAEGRLGITEDSPRTLDVLLGADGPPLEPDQRAWLEAMGQQPLGLYEVDKISAGGMMSLLDLEDPDRPPLAVYDRVVAEVVEEGTVFGARVLPVGDHHELAAAHYPFHDHLVPDLENQLDLFSEEASNPENRVTPEELTWQVGRMVIECWHQQLVEDYISLDMEEGFDPNADIDGLEEDYVFAFDRFRVKDWQALTAALAAVEECEGSREIGWLCWLEAIGQAAALNPSGEDELTVFTVVEEWADEARQWLEATAGTALEHVERRIDDVLGQSSPETPDLPPEEMLAWRQRQVEDHYRDWLDSPLPYLSGKTPRFALREPERRAAVIELLLGYESQEEGRAEREDRPAASFEFLWRAAGLDREEELETI